MRRDAHPKEGGPGVLPGSRVKGRRCPSGEKGTTVGGGILTWPRLEREPPWGGGRNRKGSSAKKVGIRHPFLLTWT